MMALTQRVIRQIAGDKRTVAMILLAPILLLTLINLLLGTTSYTPTIAADTNALPPPLVTALQAQDAHINEISPDAGFDAKAFLKDNRDVDAVVSMSGQKLQVTLYESSTKGNTAMKAIQAAMVSLNPSAGIETRFVIGNPDESLFDSLSFVFLGVIAFFLIFIVSGMALVRERSGGTIERMLMTPITRIGVVAGYTAGYSLFAVIQAAILVLFSIYALGVTCKGNVLWVIFVMLLLAVAAVSFGELISIFANTEFQVVQLIPLTIIPQIFFSGLIPLDTIPYHLGKLCYITPIYYGCTAIKSVMRAGGGFFEIWQFLLALFGYIAILTVLNTLALKKFRKI